MNQLIISKLIFFFILISCLPDVVMIFDGRFAHKNFPLSLELWSIKFKTSNNQDLMTGIFGHLILLHFTLSSHWLPVIFSFVLIGHYHNSNKKSSDLKKKEYSDCTCTYQLLSSWCTLIDHVFWDDTFYYFGPVR